MSQGPLCPNLTQKVQKEVSQIANRNLPRLTLLGGLSVNLNHLKTIQPVITYKIVKKIFTGEENTIYYGLPFKSFRGILVKNQLILTNTTFPIKLQNFQILNVVVFFPPKLLEHSVLRTFTAQGGMSGPNYIDSFDELRS